jgi:hypothetical protein
MSLMGKRLILVLLLVLCSSSAMAQSVLPGFTQHEMNSYNHEDLSDILRLLPGMYPEDLGTFGAPLFFRPWGLWPGELRYTLDGLPLERRYDGLWDPGLLPISEIDSVIYESSPLDGVFPGAAGRIEFVTRDLPVDSPRSEVHMREGYYGYGTVDFAHAQPLYRKLTLQLTGRLGWYDGMRPQTGSRLTHIRGKLGFHPARSWRLEAACSGIKSHSDSELNGNGETSERTEGQLAFLPTDSMSSSFRPSVRIFLREDKERWGMPWSVRDFSGGGLFNVSMRRFGHHLQSTGLARLSSRGFPDGTKLDSHDIELGVSDSTGIESILGVEFGGGLRLEEGWDAPATRYGIGGYLPVTKSSVLFGRFQRLESFPAPLWLDGSYPLSERPLFLSPSLALLGDSLVASPKQKESSTQIESGIFADLRRVKVRIAAVRISTENEFTPWTSASHPTPSADSRWGGALEGRMALRRDLFLETRWSWLWLSESDLQSPDELRGFSRLYFDEFFFKAPLHIQASISHTYLGRRRAFGTEGIEILEPVHLVGFRVAAQIRHFRIFWGTENIGAKHYEYVPGFLMIRKEEYWGFDWTFWY